jgi:hypothetical protein
LARQSHNTDIMLERIHRGQDDASFWIYKRDLLNGTRSVGVSVSM